MQCNFTPWIFISLINSVCYKNNASFPNTNFPLQNLYIFPKCSSWKRIKWFKKPWKDFNQSWLTLSFLLHFIHWILLSIKLYIPLHFKHIPFFINQIFLKSFIVLYFLHLYNLFNPFLDIISFFIADKFLFQYPLRSISILRHLFVCFYMLFLHLFIM